MPPKEKIHDGPPALGIMLGVGKPRGAEEKETPEALHHRRLGHAANILKAVHANDAHALDEALAEWHPVDHQLMEHEEGEAEHEEEDEPEHEAEEEIG